MPTSSVATVESLRHGSFVESRVVHGSFIPASAFARRTLDSLDRSTREDVTPGPPRDEAVDRPTPTTSGQPLKTSTNVIWPLETRRRRRVIAKSRLPRCRNRRGYRPGATRNRSITKRVIPEVPTGWRRNVAPRTAPHPTSNCHPLSVSRTPSTHPTPGRRFQRSTEGGRTPATVFTFRVTRRRASVRPTSIYHVTVTRSPVRDVPSPSWKTAANLPAVPTAALRLIFIDGN